MAGKAAAVHGCFQDATPFQFHEGQPGDGSERSMDFFGRQLTSAGYAYLGSEPVYSGLSGTMMQMDIFTGLVYYQVGRVEPVSP